MDKNLELLEREIEEIKGKLEGLQNTAEVVLEEYFGGEGSLELACVENLIGRLDVMLCEIEDAKEQHLEYIAEYGD